jgi:hypothetical protein
MEHTYIMVCAYMQFMTKIAQQMDTTRTSALSGARMEAMLLY